MTPGLTHLLGLQGIDNSERESRHRAQDAHTSILSTTHLGIQWTHGMALLCLHRLLVMMDMSKRFSKYKIVPAGNGWRRLSQYKIFANNFKAFTELSPAEYFKSTNLLVMKLILCQGARSFTSKIEDLFTASTKCFWNERPDTVTCK